MDVAILGITGFLGAWTARAMIKSGHRVVGVCRETSDRWRLAGLEGLSVRAEQGHLWPGLIRELRPEIVISLDWQGVASKDRDSEQMQRVNVTRQAEIIRAASDAGVQRFVGVGSQAEYGLSYVATRETRAPAPVTEYGRAKLAAFHQLSELAGELGLPWRWARVFSSYGPMDREGTVLGAIADAAAARRRISLSSCMQQWSFLAAADTATAIEAVSVSPGASGIVNIAHPSSPPLKDSLLLFASAVGVDPADVYEFATDDQAPPPLIANVDRLSGLGWSPTVEPQDGLKLTADWLMGRTIADPFSGTVLPARPRAT